MAENRFLQGTLILLVTSLILKVMGFVYQIAIIRLVGAEPVGVLNMAYPFYIAFVVLATFGIPLAIAKIVAAQAGDEGLIHKTMRLSFAIVLGLGLGCFCFGLLVMPRIFGGFVGDGRIVWCYYVLLPGIVIVPVSSVIRGYFQGRQQMLYPSVAQIAEQIVRLISGIVLVLWLKPLGVRFAAMGLAGGMMIGELAGMLVILGFYLRFGPKATAKSAMPTSSLLAEMLTLSVPTTLSKLTSSVDMAIEASLIPFCLLQVGYNHSQAANLYGQFSGVAMTLLTIPMILTGALSTALVPAISEAAAKGQRSKMQLRCSEALRITYIFSIPVIVVLFFQGENLAQLLFHLEGVGSVLQILSLGAIFLYLGQTTVGIMQGLGLTRAVFINNLVGAVAKLVCIYYFTGVEKWGLKGTACAFVLSYALQCLLNLSVILKQVEIRLRPAEVLIPPALCAIMLLYLDLAARGLQGILSGDWLTLMAVGSAGLLYLGLLVVTKQFSLAQSRL